ncbi:aminopeptidase P family protein [Deinococcus psychrotolerans]|uniref:Aminopeptidase P family protein n=1 Tax=Deinococcus psychrotolerans TaxID=2489213 RepID=A0A3G8YPK2_9DEIO|nr:M24 family metallopeptidase [Deinococcus psychrotolerans]AZI43561.1 aminopeptidase P family protein [Deinococcus psychrotolerans]
MATAQHDTLPVNDPLRRIQQALQEAPEPVDGWLIYDFRGLNPHAGALLNLGGSFLTRRYFVWVPTQGRPALLHHRIEGGTWKRLLAGAEVDFIPYSAHTELDEHLRRLVGGKTVAAEYSPQAAVPYVSYVDAGTLERIRGVGAEVVSSADLLQGFLAWSAEDLAAHQRAVAVLMRAKDMAFELIHQRLQAGQPVTELDVQAVIAGQIEEAGMLSGHPVNVSFAANAADSHYEPGGDLNATLQVGQCVLIDLWAQEAGRPFGDVTWVGYAGEPSAEYSQAWQAVAAARDKALDVLQERSASGTLEGWEVDRAARDVIEAAGLGEFFSHRLGHSLGVQIHGSGANLDDLETHDTRKLLPGLSVTVEPGVYPAERGYGIRSEVDVLLTDSGPLVTTPVQIAPFVLGRAGETWAQVRARGLGEES